MVVSIWGSNIQNIFPDFNKNTLHFLFKYDTSTGALYYFTTHWKKLAQDVYTAVDSRNL